ncbi:MAG TPA: cellulase family glycosylhydrolase [Gaiellaceae bacterium]|nr:cellulase family glycosylhydrolase [Gaiellaceae bacterium]
MRSRVTSLRLPLVAVAIVCVCVAATAGSSALAAVRSHKHAVINTSTTLPLRTAIFDPFLFGSPQQSQAFDLVHSAGGSYVRVLVRWFTIAPLVLPDVFDPTNPNDPNYLWSQLDDTVEAAVAAGVTPILDIEGAPAWAWDVQPVGSSGGTPNSTDLGEFATALAAHYDGMHGPPAVHVFQVWNEPNLSLDLTPVDPNAYRDMVNAVADSVHAVDPANLVVAGGMDPFANTSARFHTMAPLTFMRGLLCLSKGAKPHVTCNTPVHFDIWAHHPYTFQGPFGHAKSADDVSLGDLPRMNALLQAAIKLHQVVSAHPVQFWVDEFSWDTNPPRRSAAPPALEARWTAEAFHEMWLSGVSLVTWFMLQDQPGTNPYQSGLYFTSPTLASAKAKPMRTAYRFPFVAYLGKKGTVSVWGRDATSSPATVAIQQQHNGKGKWKTVAKIKANRYGIFLATLKLKATAKDWLRASAPGSGNALPFSLTPPSPKLRYGPFGN